MASDGRFFFESDTSDASYDLYTITEFLLIQHLFTFYPNNPERYFDALPKKSELTMKRNEDVKEKKYLAI